MGLDGYLDQPLTHSSSSAQPSSNIVSSTVHVKRDAAGAVKRREKRTGVGIKSRKRVSNVLDNDLGEATDSGDETDLADDFGFSEAIAAP